MNLAPSGYDQLPATTVKEGTTRRVVYTKNLMMAVIDITSGPWEEPEPYHSHPHEQIACIAEGEIIFYCEGREEAHLKEGDTYAIPSGLKHTIKALTASVRLIDCFTPIREDFISPREAE